MFSLRFSHGRFSPSYDRSWWAFLHFPLAKCADHALTSRVMTRPQVEICAKLLMVAIVLTFIWGASKVLALMGLI